MVIEKQTNKCFNIDIANLVDHNIEREKTVKLDNYGGVTMEELRVEVVKMWNRETMVIQSDQSQRTYVSS